MDSMETFQTVSEEAFCELRLYGVLRSSHQASSGGIMLVVERVSTRRGEAG
jgi:hypothetical protein